MEKSVRLFTQQLPAGIPRKVKGQSNYCNCHALQLSSAQHGILTISIIFYMLQATRFQISSPTSQFDELSEGPGLALMFILLGTGKFKLLPVPFQVCLALSAWQKLQVLSPLPAKATAESVKKIPALDE
ncbi:hypothetical protein [Pseudochelatococcus sp. G4_1912]|uniref:hypothetical protein n=1 Tax=Pseudochelatococcus sp. G4_1912 TaxID=3114288 RepID=UPI0039C71BBD